MSNFRGGSLSTKGKDNIQDGFEGEIGVKYSKNTKVSTTHHNHFYGGNDVGDYSDESDDELQKRKKAQAELEREEAELKRNIKSLMKMTPESRALDDPILADRVRNARYEPQRYNDI